MRFLAAVTVLFGFFGFFAVCACDTTRGDDGPDLRDEDVDSPGDAPAELPSDDLDDSIDHRPLDVTVDIPTDLPVDLPADLPPGRVVPVSIDPTAIDGALDARYIGFAFDTAQLTGGMWWLAGFEERQVAQMPDLEDPKLIRLTSYLEPSLMRVGGTDCDAVYFCPEPGLCEVPPAYQDTFSEEDRLETVLTHDAVRRSADFAAAVGAEILFCINLGPGPRDPETGEWTTDNARALIRFANSLVNRQVFTLWEPGNEINSASYAFDMPYAITPQLFAGDLLTLRALVDTEDPGARVAAPGSYVSPFGEFNDFTPRLMQELSELGETPLDALSWHLYATQSTSCPAQVHPADREHLFAEWLNYEHRTFARGMREAAGALPVWNTESASAQCGGQEGVSDTMLDALWYADWMGLMAEEGTSLLVRHSLVGADYSLLEPGTFDPRPTFLVLVMLRRLVARGHLPTEVDRDLLKAHGYCSAELDGGVAAVVVNPTDEPMVAQIDLSGQPIESAERWIVQASGDIDSKHATINGESPLADGTIPEVSGHAVPVHDGVAFAELPSASAIFVLLEPVDAVVSCR